MKETWWDDLHRFGIRPGLERIRLLLDRLGNPQAEYPVIHVAGTNGKGSTAVMIAQALMAEGYRVGLTTSPDLGQINERVMINRQPLDPVLWDLYGASVEQVGRSMPEVPTFFEAVVALAFLAFQKASVDIAVVEVGLGGRLDATNIVPPPLLSVITPVAFDHMDRLGHTIEEIAAEKAGILKRGTRLVLSRQPYPSAREVILARAMEWEVPVVEPTLTGMATEQGARLVVPSIGEVEVPLFGEYQAENLATAWTAITVLRELGWIRDLNRVRAGLAGTQWPGRFQVVQQNPLWVVDGAHNVHGIEHVAKTLTMEPWSRYTWDVVFGVLNDKPAETMLDVILPMVRRVIFTEVPGQRGRDPRELIPLVPKDKWVDVIPDPGEAVETGLSLLNPGHEALLTVGSLSLLMHLNQRNQSIYRPSL